MKRPLKAFILAAGFGSRLRPLTDDCPKTLLPFLGIPILYLILAKLAHVQVDEIFVNGHYLSSRIESALHDFSLPIKTTFCPEHPTILGTGGAISALRPHFQNCDVIVINGDIVSDIDLEKLIHQHQEQGPLATMGLLREAAPSKTLIWCENQQIQSIGAASPKPGSLETAHSFACAHVLSSEFIQEIPDGPCEIIPIYRKLITQGHKIGFLATQPFWFDIGSPSAYFEAHMAALTSQTLSSLSPHFPLAFCWEKIRSSPFHLREGESLLDSGSECIGPLFSSSKLALAPGCRLGPYVVNMSSHSSLPKKLCIRNSLLLPGAYIEPGENIDYTIVARDFRLDMSHLKKI